MLKCKECLLEKDSSMFYKHPLTKTGVMGRCKECVRSGRRTDHEMSMSRERDRDRYENNDRRRLYCIWRGMNARCYDKSNSHYKWYGLKGISIGWENFNDFYNDVIDMYTSYYQKYGKDRKMCQFDRINNNGNYEKGNVRFVTAKENANNRSF